MLTETSRAGIGLLEDSSSPDVAVAFTDRMGGVSTTPYDSLNLAARVGDHPSSVGTNRRKAAKAAGFDVDRLALARQVHGRDLIDVRPGAAGVVGEGDALAATEPGVVLGILTADCAPVLLAGPGGIAVAHAGWRGLVAGVIDVAVARLGVVERAWVGPAIHSCCYEVGPEVIEAFGAVGLPIADDTHVDPAAAAGAALDRAGVPQVDIAAPCTSCDPRYFSYRRDGVTGRQGAFVWIR